MINFLSFDIAFQICSGPRFSLINFNESADSKKWLSFAHYAHFEHIYFEEVKEFYSNKRSLHVLDIACKCCKKRPKRNYAGVGNINLMKSLTKHDFILFCDSCVRWRDTSKFKPMINNNNQLKLF